MDYWVLVKLSGGPFDGQVAQVEETVQSILMSCGSGNYAVYDWMQDSEDLVDMRRMLHTGWVARPADGDRVMNI